MLFYLYVRENKYWNDENIYKIGITSNIPERHSQYITHELEAGSFMQVFEINVLNDEHKLLFDNNFKKNFREYNCYVDAGTELFYKDILYKIIPYFIEMGINYRMLTDTDIESLVRKCRISNLIDSYHPRNHQQDILNIINEFYQQNHIGKLIWGPGMGKSLMATFIVRKFQYKSVVIGVPGKYLQTQMRDTILKLYPKKENILFVGGQNKKRKDLQFIESFLQKETDSCKFIITTYNSCGLLANENLKFDFKIGDEAHHLVGIKDNEQKRKKYIQFHNIQSSKTLFMTATEKSNIKKDTNIYSMDDTETFGSYIDNKSVKWAIENKIITDYKLLILKNTEMEVDNIISNLKIKVENKELFISAYMTLKALETYDDLTHMLIYTNTMTNAEIVQRYIEEILEKNIFKNLPENLYNKALHSKSKCDLEDEIQIFRNSKYGIIACVYIFGEGFDEPFLNGVCFAENMISYIRITQCSIRANRLSEYFPNKIAYIIIPYIDNHNWLHENKSFDKCKKIIYQLRNVDESIEQKIQVLSNIYVKIEPSDKEHTYIDSTFETNIEELLKIKIRLRYSKTLASDFTEEEDEYYFYKEQNKERNILSQPQYYQNKELIPYPEEYFKKNGVWKNWKDFLGFDTKQYLQSKDEWVFFCKTHTILEIEDYDKLCEQYAQLPKEPALFYEDFTNIKNELGINNKMRR